MRFALPNQQANASQTYLGLADETVVAADIAGIRAFVVHAKDAGAAAFYERFDFVPSSTDARHLFMLVKDLRRAAAT